MKVSYGKDGIVALTSAKACSPIGFWRKGSAIYEVNLFPIEDGRAVYGAGFRSRTYAMVRGTTIREERRKDATAKIEAILEQSIAV